MSLERGQTRTKSKTKRERRNKINNKMKQKKVHELGPDPSMHSMMQVTAWNVRGLNQTPK